MKILFTTVGCALALIGAAAQAQQTPDQSGMPSDQEHRNGEHHQGGGQRGFDAMDADHDGTITLDEWKAAGRREERFNDIDVNHTGRISREDLRAYMQKMRAEHQQNGGGWRGNGGGQPDGQ
jgi:opacity protein-like surface antigen